MPRIGGVFQLLAGSKGTPNTTIQSAPYNAVLDDFAADANAARPVTAGGTGATSATAARTALGLTIGTNVQAYDALLQAIAALTTSADKVIYATGVDTVALASLTSFGRSLIDDADAAAARATLGVVLGTNVQAYDAGLTSIAGLTTAADQMIYTTAADAYATTALTPFARTLLDDAAASNARATLGLAAVAASGSATDLTTGTVPNARISGNYDGIGYLTANTLRILSTGDVSGTSTAHGFQLGPSDGVNVRFDTNEFQVYNNGVATNESYSFNCGGTMGINGATAVTLNSPLVALPQGKLTLTSTTPEIKLIDSTSGQYSGRIRIDANNVYFDSSTDDVTFGEVFRFELDTKNGYVNNSLIWTDANTTSARVISKIGYTPANSASSITAGNGLSGGGTLAATRTVTLGTPGTITGSSTNSVTTTSHTHALTLASGDITGALGFTPVNPTITLTAGNGLSGGGTLAASRNLTLGTPGSITNSSTNAVTTTSHTHALGFTAAEVYTGSARDNTNFPVGTVLAVVGLANTERNAAVSVWLHSNLLDFSGVADGAQLSGTWRAKGRVANNNYEVQRTA